MGTGSTNKYGHKAYVQELSPLFVCLLIITYVETTKASDYKRMVKLVVAYSDDGVLFSHYKSCFSLSNLEE